MKTVVPIETIGYRDVGRAVKNALGIPSARPQVVAAEHREGGKLDSLCDPTGHDRGAGRKHSLRTSLRASSVTTAAGSAPGSVSNAVARWRARTSSTWIQAGAKRGGFRTRDRRHETQRVWRPWVISLTPGNVADCTVVRRRQPNSRRCGAQSEAVLAETVPPPPAPRRDRTLVLSGPIRQRLRERLS